MLNPRETVLSAWLALSLALALPAAAHAGDDPVVINEIRIDQASSDTDEYFELAGEPGGSLDGLTYLVIGDGGGGNSGVIEEVTSLDDQTLGDDGLFLVAESTFGLGTPDLVVSLNFENTDNVTHLLVAGFSGSNGQDLDTDNDGELDSTPWDAVVDLIALIEEENPPAGTEWHYGPPTLGPDNNAVPWHAYRCQPSGVWAIGDRGLGLEDSPGGPNALCPDCGFAPAGGIERISDGQAAISIDGRYDDWDDVVPLYVDGIGDGTDGGVDFDRLWVADDERFLFIRFEVGAEISFSDVNNLHIYIDTDLDECTGKFVQGIGAELEFEPGERRGTFRFQDQEADVFQYDLQFRAAPSFHATEFELAIGKDSRPDGLNLLFQGPSVRVVVRDEPGGDRMPNTGETLTFNFDAGDPPVDVAIPFERTAPGDLRIATLNVHNDAPWDPAQSPRFGRLFAAADPDVIALQEVSTHSDNETQTIVSAWLPDRTWTVRGNADVKLAAAYPILDSWALDAATSGNLAALVDTSAVVGTPTLFIVGHLPCCDNEDERQAEADQIMAFIRDAMTPGGDVDVAPNTPIMIVGDLNLVGSAQSVRTLLTGDIDDEKTYGPDFDPDWDGTGLASIVTRQTEKRMGYTWRNDESRFWPGQLDNVMYTDTVLDAARNYIVYTSEMSPENLNTYGLFNTDSFATDHLLLIADFRSACAADLDGSGDVGFGDLLLLLAAWGPCDECPEDLDDSGDVDFNDLLIVLSAWGDC